MRQHPLELPLAPRWPEKPFTPGGATCSPSSATGGCPPPSLCHINEWTPLSNEEPAFPQPLRALFGRVLRKKHAGSEGQDHATTRPAEMQYLYDFSMAYLDRLYSAADRETCRLRLLDATGDTRSDYAATETGHQDRPRINFQAAGARGDSEPVIHAWRRRRDSNPRYAFGAYNGLANRRLQPLGHVSASWKAYRIRPARSNSGIESR